MMRFRKKPVEVEARQLTPGSFASVFSWCRGHSYNYPKCRITIKTLEGLMTAEPNDWIIKGVKGEFYPCKPDIFEQTYEPVELPDER